MLEVMLDLVCCGDNRLNLFLSCECSSWFVLVLSHTCCSLVRAAPTGPETVHTSHMAVFVLFRSSRIFQRTLLAPSWPLRLWLATLPTYIYIYAELVVLLLNNIPSSLLDHSSSSSGHTCSRHFNFPQWRFLFRYDI